MPIIICRNCGNKTNTAISDHVNSKDDMADVCFGRFVDGIIEEGCAFDKADGFDKCYIRNLIRINREMKVKVIEEK